LFDVLLPETRYVGEIGLDGAPEFRKHWKDQVAVFEHILARCSDAGGRIMSIHSRRASGAVLDFLEKCPRAGIPVLHWFSGPGRDLDRATTLGCWFSVGPAMLASDNGRALASRMPRDRVLTESDGPFAQVEGVALLPWQADNAIGGLGSVWSMSNADVSRTISDNFKCLLSNIGGASSLEPDQTFSSKQSEAHDDT
jgi:TatD DNase family protein